MASTSVQGQPASQRKRQATICMEEGHSSQYDGPGYDDHFNASYLFLRVHDLVE